LKKRLGSTPQRWARTVATDPGVLQASPAPPERLETPGHPETPEHLAIRDLPAPCRILLRGSPSCLNPKEARRALGRTPSATFRPKWGPWANGAPQGHPEPLDPKASRGPAGSLESTAPSGPRARRGHAACRASRAKTVTTGTTGPQALQAPRARVDPGASQACRAFLGPRAIAASLDWTVLRERWERLGPRVRTDPPGQEGRLGPWGRRGREASAGERGHLAHLASEALTASPGPRVHPVAPASPGLQASLGPPGPRETWGSRDLRGPRVYRAAEASRAGPGPPACGARWAPLARTASTGRRGPPERRAIRGHRVSQALGGHRVSRAVQGWLERKGPGAFTGSGASRGMVA